MGAIEAGIGTDVVAWFQSWGTPTIGYLLYPFHIIGGPYGYLVLLPIVYWGISKYHGRRLMVLSLGGALIGQYLKLALARPRPAAVSPDRISPMVRQTGYGIPSGHTLFATVTGGYAWYRFPRMWVRIAAVVWVVLMGASRMIHGVHFPQDVLAGFVVGLLVILAFRWIDIRVASRIIRLPVGPTFAAIALVGVICFVLALVVNAGYEERKETLSVVGALIGGLSGFVLEFRFIRFSSGGNVVLRVVRTAAGLIVTVGVFFALEVLYLLVMGDAAGTGALIVYVIRYALVSLFVTAGVPYLFVRTRLAHTEQ